jgi:hypothetical protein
MAFEWIVDRYKGTMLGKPANPNKAMMAQDVATHAFILKNLGWGREHIQQRCLDNVHWDYELRKSPLSDDEVEAVVNVVFDR